MKTKMACDKCNLVAWVEDNHLYECAAVEDPRNCKMRRVEIARSEQISPERGHTHGNFADNADFAITARNAMRSANGWQYLTKSQQLALEEIQLKIARVISGGGINAQFKEHFDDIEGYAKLGGKDCV